MADVYVSVLGNDTTGDGSAGNPYATPGKAAGVMAGGDTMFVKSGTYVFGSNTANIATGRVSLPAGSVTAPTRIIGYDATATATNTDTKPILRASASTSSVLITQAGNYCEFYNLEIDGDNRGVALFSDAASWSRIARCKLHNSSLSGTKVSIGAAGTALFCEIGTYPGGGLGVAMSGRMFGCYLHDINGIVMNLGSQAVLADCIIDTNTGAGASEGAIYASGSAALISNCTIYSSNKDCIYIASGWCDIVNTIVRDATLNGITAASSTKFVRLWNCAGYNNTSANVGANVPVSSGFVTLSADPHTNAAAGDFSLNNTAGGGAACRAAGIPGAFPGGATTGYLDIGAAQHADPSGLVSPLASPLIRPARSQ